MKIKNIWNHHLGYHLTPRFISKSLFAASDTWCRPANVEASRVKLFSERAKRPVMPFNRAFKGRASTSHDRDFYHTIFFVKLSNENWMLVMENIACDQLSSIIPMKSQAPLSKIAKKHPWPRLPICSHLFLDGFNPKLHIPEMPLRTKAFGLRQKWCFWAFLGPFVQWRAGRMPQLRGKLLNGACHAANMVWFCRWDTPASWWFQPIWKIWVKMGIFPK